MLEKLKKWMPSRRKLIQLYFGLLFNANLKGFVTGNIYQGSTKQVCVPGMNCYSCPGAVGACPLGSLQGSFSAGRSTVFYVCGILLLYSLLFGRMICGWLCPFGLIQELLYKIKTPKLKKSPVTRVLSYLKYVLLVFLVVIVPVSYAFKDTPLPAFCKYICPAGTIEGGLSLLANKVNESYFAMLGPIFTWKFLVMLSIVVGCVFAFRLFCRFLCPLGALYGLFNKISLFGVKVNAPDCTNCGLCVSHCKLDVKHVGDQECISCGECMAVCPTKAIQWKGNLLLLKQNEGHSPSPKQKKLRTLTRWAAAVVMLGVLVGAVAWYWNQETPGGTPDVSPDRGNAVGDLCYGYPLELMDENGLTGETLDPTATGKITVVNFWGTWCTPCVGELPYFDRIATDYSEDVTVIAVHSYLSIETAPSYIGQYYPDSLMRFATDYPLDDVGLVGGYYSSLGGRGTYPYTLVLDEKGVVAEIFVDKVEYEDLNTVITRLLNN